MAITTSGQITFQDIRDEFITTTSYTQYELDDFYNMDPYIGIPLSGEIGFDDFYGGSIRTTEIDGGASFDDSWDDDNTDPDNAGRKGFSVFKGSAFYQAEAGESQNAFGSASRTGGLFSTGQQFTALYFENTSQTSSGFSADEKVMVFKRGPGNTATTAGWDSISFKLNNQHNSRWWESSSGLKTLTLYRSSADSFDQASNTSVGGVSAYGWRYQINLGGTSYATSDETSIWWWLRSISNLVPGDTFTGQDAYTLYGDGGQGNYAALKFIGGTTPLQTYYQKSINGIRTGSTVTNYLYIYTRLNGSTIEIYAKIDTANSGNTPSMTFHTDYGQSGTSSSGTTGAGTMIGKIDNAGSGWKVDFFSQAASGPTGYTTSHVAGSNSSLSGNIPSVTAGNALLVNNTQLWTGSFPSSTEYLLFFSSVSGGGQKRGDRLQLVFEHESFNTINFNFDVYTTSGSV